MTHVGAVAFGGSVGCRARPFGAAPVPHANVGHGSVGGLERRVDTALEEHLRCAAVLTLPKRRTYALGDVGVDAVEEEENVCLGHHHLQVGQRAALGQEWPRALRRPATVLREVARERRRARVEPEVDLAAALARWVGVRHRAHRVSVVVLRPHVVLEHALRDLKR